MGLVRTIAEGAFSYIGDIWEDYIYCDVLDNNSLIRKGCVRSFPGAGSRADDNVIAQYSKIAVNAGQACIIAEGGKIIDFTVEQGGYEYVSEMEPSAFCGTFGNALRKSFDEIRARSAMDGRAGKGKRAYFVNLNEICNTRFEFGNLPYYGGGSDETIALKGFGYFSFRIVDPLVFYASVSGNGKDQYNKNNLELQIKAEVPDALIAAREELAKDGLRYDEMPPNAKKVTDDLIMEKIRKDWRQTRGIAIVSMAFSNADSQVTPGVRVDDVSAAEPMKESVEKSNSEPRAGNVGDTWVCECGTTNALFFCTECGKPKPKGIKCPACGFEPPAELQKMKFCPNCGNKMGESGQ